MSNTHASEPAPTNPNAPSIEVIREFQDRGAQWLFEDPLHLQSLLQLLEPQLAQRLDVSRAQRLNRTFIPADLTKKETDLIFRIPYRAQQEGQEWEVLVYVLLEHQSTHDPYQ